ncbi:hypothetical protein [Campylobacter concisus]|uniref:Uncharacterized protein n=1 Tax=Campylobacter concisus TaxID=199 RepID=A0A2R4P2P6_9BACT|nr:hypothetical protein [Campylobacter concisus]AVX44940.1 hypothetical protein CCS77_1879 [Campylobacter concisus]EIF07065.1 hypothetical protein UNSWCD_482 [Campylobacter concisus UNSWCD]ERJ22589.1 hypothetical protein UNSW1_1474 [Campylobacter concisus UNSW1]ERJ28832.1 hypothetical protein ATCC51561_281 [Campylobacter concisus ATCC 51561]
MKTFNIPNIMISFIAMRSHSFLPIFIFLKPSIYKEAMFFKQFLIMMSKSITKKLKE